MIAPTADRPLRGCPVAKERWLPIEGTDGMFEVSDLGNVRSWWKMGPIGGRADTPRIRKPYLNKRTGYLYVTYRRPDGSSRTRSVHRLVADAFLGPCPDGMQCAHLNGDRMDNRAVNFAWATPAENVSHKVEHGTQTRGEDHPTSRLTERDIRRMQEMRAAGAIYQDIADQYGVSISQAWRVLNGQRWAHLQLGTEPAENRGELTGGAE